MVLLTNDAHTMGHLLFILERGMRVGIAIYLEK